MEMMVMCLSVYGGPIIAWTQTLASMYMFANWSVCQFISFITFAISQSEWRCLLLCGARLQPTDHHPPLCVPSFPSILQSVHQPASQPVSQPHSFAFYINTGTQATEQEWSRSYAIILLLKTGHSRTAFDCKLRWNALCGSWGSAELKTIIIILIILPIINRE